MASDGNFKELAVKTYAPMGFSSLYDVDMSEIRVPASLKAGHALWLFYEYRELLRTASQEEKINLTNNTTSIARHFAHPTFGIATDGQVFAALYEISKRFSQLDDESGRIFAFLEEPWPSVKQEEEVTETGYFNHNSPEAAAAEQNDADGGSPASEPQNSSETNEGDDDEERLPDMFVDASTASDRIANDTAENSLYGDNEGDEYVSNRFSKNRIDDVDADSDMIQIKPDPDADEINGMNEPIRAANFAKRPAMAIRRNERVVTLLTPKINRAAFFTASGSEPRFFDVRASNSSNAKHFNLTSSSHSSMRESSKSSAYFCDKASSVNKVTKVRNTETDERDADDTGDADEQLEQDHENDDDITDEQTPADVGPTKRAKFLASLRKNGQTKKSIIRQRRKENVLRMQEALKIHLQKRREARENQADEGAEPATEEEVEDDKEQLREDRLHSLRGEQEREARREELRKRLEADRIATEERAREWHLRAEERERERAAKAEENFINRQIAVLLKHYRKGDLQQKFVLKPEMLGCSAKQLRAVEESAAAAVSAVPEEAVAAVADDEDEPDDGAHVVVTRSGRKARLKVANYRDLAKPKYEISSEEEESEDERTSLPDTSNAADTAEIVVDADNVDASAVATGKPTVAEVDRNATTNTADDGSEASGSVSSSSPGSTPYYTPRDDDFVARGWGTGKVPYVRKRMGKPDREKILAAEMQQFEQEFRGRVQAGDGAVRPLPIRKPVRIRPRVEHYGALSRAKCLYCGDVVGIGGIHRHVDAHLHTELTAPCPHCDLKFTTSKRVASHIRFVHLRVNSFPCKACAGHVSKSRDEYKVHCKTPVHIEAAKRLEETGGTTSAANDDKHKKAPHNSKLIGRVLQPFERWSDGPEFVPIDGDGNEIWQEIDGMEKYKLLNQLSERKAPPKFAGELRPPRPDSSKTITVDTKIYRENYCGKCQKYVNFSSDSFAWHCKIVHPEMTSDDIDKARCSFWQQRQVKISNLPACWRETHTLETVYAEPIPAQSEEEFVVEPLQVNAASPIQSNDENAASSSSDESSISMPLVAKPTPRKRGPAAAKKTTRSSPEAPLNDALVFPVDVATLVDGPAPASAAKKPRQRKKPKPNEVTAPNNTSRHNQATSTSMPQSADAVCLDHHARSVQAVAHSINNFQTPHWPAIANGGNGYLPVGYNGAQYLQQAAAGHFQQQPVGPAPAAAAACVPEGHIVSYNMVEVQRLLAQGWRVERTVFNG